jgi:glucokinase
MSTKKWSIGMDLGGTKIKAARIDESGTIQNEIEEKTDVSGGVEAVQHQIEKLAGTLTDDASTNPLSLGIGVAGQIDKKTGAVTYAPNLDWHDVPLDAALEKRLDIPVTVLNDVRAAAWGEWLHGAGKGCRDMICIFIGTGVGGSFVSEGRLAEGASNAAGEVGHMTVLLDGPECHCGNKGCLEALIGSWAIQRDARKALKEDPDTETLMLSIAGGDIEKVTAKTVIKAHNKGDARASEIITEVKNALAGALTGITNTLNPEKIILGGGVIEHLPDVIPQVEKEVNERALEAATEPLNIVPVQLQDDSGVIGAAAYTFQIQKDAQ